MFIKHLKSQYLAYFLISFAIGGKHLIKSFQGPEVFLSLLVNLAMVFTQAFVLCTLGFGIRMMWRWCTLKLRSPRCGFPHAPLMLASLESLRRSFLTKDALICFLLGFSFWRYIDNVDNVWVELATIVLFAGIYVLYSYWRDKKSSQPPEQHPH